MDNRLIHEIMALAIPIVAIVVGGLVIVAKSYIRHRERIALIEMGIHPDYPPLDADEQQLPPGPSALKPGNRAVAGARIEH